MNPLPRHGARAKRVLPAPELDVLAFASRFASALPMLAAQGSLAFASRTVRDLFHRQVVTTHQLAAAARKHAVWQSQACELAWPGPWRDAATIADSVHRIAIDAWTNTADQFGRAFAHKAFAFPVHRSRR